MSSRFRQTPGAVRRGRWVSAARREDGYTIMIALVVLVVTLALATVAVTATLSSRSHSTRDLRSQRALQAADAGINSGIYRFDQVNLANFNFTGGSLALGTLLDCVVPKASVSASGYASITGFSFKAEASVATGACSLPDASGVGGAIPDTVKVGNHAFYEMQQLGGATTSGSVVGPNIVLHPKIVSVGVEDAGNSTTCVADAPTSGGATSGCVVRRVLATLAPIDPFQVVEATGDLTLNAGLVASTVVNGDVRTNRDFKQTGGLTYVSTNVLNGALIGNVTYGRNKSTALIPVTTFTQQTNAVSRPAVTVNDAGCPVACTLPDLPGVVTAASLGGLNAANGVAYNSVTHAVSMTHGTMTFTPGDYVFCDFKVTGGVVQTNIPASSTAPVRIFIDSPTSARCSANGLGSTQGSFQTSVGMSNLVGGVVSLTGSAYLQIYVVGGSTTSPPVNIGGNLIESMFLYAPTSNVSMNATTFEGNLIGHDVTITAPLALVLTQNVGLNNYSLANNVGAFHVAAYSECTPVYPLPQPDPTVGC
jgi:hypothetical protein